MKIALIGYGKMGQMLDALAPSFNIKVVAIIDPHHEKASHQEISREAVLDADVCIDFTNPESALKNIEKLCELKKSVVVGTTGFQISSESLMQKASLSDVGIFWAPNFSVGVYLFSKMVESASMLINAFDDFEISCSETHHIHKKDAPSGTALMLLEKVLSQVERKKSMTAQDPKSDEGLIESHRIGETIGEHTVNFSSQTDHIKLTHSCTDRKSFAKGALKAALWLKGKVGYYTLDDMMKELINGEAYVS